MRTTLCGGEKKRGNLGFHEYPDYFSLKSIAPKKSLWLFQKRVVCTKLDIYVFIARIGLYHFSYINGTGQCAQCRYFK
jgi:hypothetical protein